MEKGAIVNHGFEHVFERAGLGPAPYKFIGITQSVYQALPGAPKQPGASCQYCGTGIMYCFHLEAANGKRFHVGCDCIKRSGDGGLIRAYKNSPQYRAMQAEKRTAKDAHVKAQLEALLAAHDPALDVVSDDPRNYKRLTVFAWVQQSLPWCGAAGRARYLRIMQRTIAEFGK